MFPVFDNPRAILNRNVSLAKRVEWRISGSVRMDEPFYNPLSFLSSLSFYWNESHGIGVSGLYFMPGLSSQGLKLKRQGIRDSKSGKTASLFDVGLAPHPLFAGFLNYQFSPLYGKISLTKTVVFNFALYSFVGAGAIGLQHGEGPVIVIPSGHFGLGQRFYFNRWFALDGGIDFLVYRGPNPVFDDLKWSKGESPPNRPAYNQFQQGIFLRFLVRLGLTVLI